MLKFRAEVSLAGNGMHKTHSSMYKTYTVISWEEDTEKAFIEVSGAMKKCGMNWIILYLDGKK